MNGMTEHSLLAMTDPVLLMVSAAAICFLGYFCARRFKNTNDFAKSVFTTYGSCGLHHRMGMEPGHSAAGRDRYLRFYCNGIGVKLLFLPWIMSIFFYSITKTLW